MKKIKVKLYYEIQKLGVIEAQPDSLEAILLTTKPLHQLARQINNRIRQKIGVFNKHHQPRT